MINVNQITSQLAKMPDPALQQYAAMHKNDPYTVSLALAEANRRKEMRAGAHMQTGPQPKVVDQEIAGIAAPQQMLPEDTGIGQLPAQNLQKMAGGGIVAFEEGGTAKDPFKNVSRELKELVLATAAKYNIDPEIAMRLVKKESGFDPTAESRRGAQGLTQLMPETAKEMGLDPAERTDPAKNLDAGFGYLRKQLNNFGNDYSKALAAYNWGQGNVGKHLEANKGNINPIGLPKETADYLTNILPMGSAEAATKPAAPTMGPNAPGAAPGAASNALPNQQKPWYDRYRELMQSGQAQNAMLQGVQDVPAALLGAPVDLANMAMRPFGYKNEAPVMGSKWLKEKFTDLGVRAPESANPDLQNIRGATEGVATLYNPANKAAPAAKLTKEGIAALGAENKAAAIEGARTNAEMSGAMSAEAKLAADAEAARRAQLAAEGPSKAASIQSANELAAARRAPVGKDMNPIGEASMLANTDTSGTPSSAPVAAPAAPEAAPGIDPAAIKALQDKAAGGDKAAAPGGISSLFSDPAFLMGMNLMASKNPNLLGGVGEAGLGTVSAMAAQKKAESDAAKAKSEGNYYQAYADAMERGAKEKNMALEAEKLVQQHMEKWGTSTAGQLAGLKGAGAAQAEEARVRDAIYRQLGISPTMGAAPAANTSGFKLLGVR